MALAAKPDQILDIIRASPRLVFDMVNINCRTATGLAQNYVLLSISKMLQVHKNMFFHFKKIP